jgi:hypothetical protein
MKKSLLEFLKELPDRRRGAGQRHKQEFGLIIIIMSMMSGYIGIRAMGDFAERNKEELIKALKPLKPRVPSFSTLRRILLQLDFRQLAVLFHQWATQYEELEDEAYYSIDGKSIKSTANNYFNDMQDFVSLVSVFSHKRKQVIAQQKFHNKKVSEIGIVKELLEVLDLEGKTITMDALHCQKNSKKN